jgi:hypothetical protein
VVLEPVRGAGGVPAEPARLDWRRTATIFSPRVEELPFHLQGAVSSYLLKEFENIYTVMDTYIKTIFSHTR